MRPHPGFTPASALRPAILVACLLSALATAPALAQTPIAPGDTIRFVHGVRVTHRASGEVVTRAEPHEVVGTFVGERHDTLVVRAGQSHVLAYRGDVSRLEVQIGTRRASLGRGAMTGALRGAVIGAVFLTGASLGNTGVTGDAWEWAAVGAGLGIVLGGAVGFVVAAFSDSPAWVDATFPAAP